MSFNPYTGVLTLSNGMRVPSRASRAGSVRGDMDDQIGSLTDRMVQGSTSLLGGIFNAFDLPGSMVRDVTAGANPLDQLLTPFSGKNRTSYIPESSGLTDPSFYGGLAAEIATDPLTYLTMGIKPAATAIGKTASKLGYMDDVVKAGAKAGKGKRASMMGAKVGDLGMDQQKLLASRLGKNLDDITDERLASAFAFRAPGIQKNFGFGENSLRHMERLDALGAKVRASALGVKAHELFDPFARNFGDLMGQLFASDVTKAQRASETVVRKATAAFHNVFNMEVPLEDIGKQATGKGARGTGVDLVSGAPRKLSYDEVRSFIENPDTIPRDFPEEFRKGVKDLQDFQKAWTAVSDSYGIKTVRLQDETGLDYLARGATLENYGKGIIQKIGKYHDAGSSALDPNTIYRIGPFKDIDGGTKVIRNIISDDAIANIFDSMGNSEAAKEQVASLIKAKYGSFMPDYFKSTKPGSMGKRYNRHFALADIISELTPAERKAGLFGNDPMFDFQQRAINMLSLAALTKETINWTAAKASLDGGGTTIGSLFSNTKAGINLRLGQGAREKEFNQKIQQQFGRHGMMADFVQPPRTRDPSGMHELSTSLRERQQVMGVARPAGVNEPSKLPAPASGAGEGRVASESQQSMPPAILRGTPGPQGQQPIPLWRKTQDEVLEGLPRKDKAGAIRLHGQASKRAADLGYPLSEDTYAKLPELRPAEIAEAEPAKLGRMAKQNEWRKTEPELFADSLTGGKKIPTPNSVSGALDRVMEVLPKEVMGQIEDAFDGEGLLAEAMEKVRLDPLGNAKLEKAIANPEAWLEVQKEKFIRQSVKNLAVPDDLAKAVRTLHGTFNDHAIAKKAQNWMTNLTNWFKATVTVPWPSFSTRNLYGGQLVHVMSGHYTSSAWDTVKNVDKFGRGKTKVIKAASDLPVVKDLLEKKGWEVTDENATKALMELAYAENFFHYEFLDTEAQRKIAEGVASLSDSAGDVTDLGGKVRLNQITLPGEHATSSMGKIARTVLGMEPGTDWNILGVRGVGDRKVSTLAPVAAGEQATERVELLNRLPAWIELQKQGYSPSEAAKRVKASQVDYSSHNFTDFERDWMKKIFPFYSWQSRMIPYSLQAYVEKPQLRALVRGEQRMSESGDEYIPERYRRQPAALVGGVNDKGYQEVMSGLDMAHDAALEPFQFGPTVGGSMERIGRGLAGSMHPLIKYGLEQGLGVSTFNGRDTQSMEGGLSRILQNTGKMLGHEDTPRIPQWADNALMSLGASRVAAPLRSMTDDRISLGDRAWKTGLNFLTGAKVSTYDPEQEKSTAMKDYLEEVGLSTRDMGKFSRLYIRNSRKDVADPELVEGISAFNEQGERARSVAERREAIELGIRQATGK